MTRLEACLLLNAIPQMGPYRIIKIISHFGNAETVFEHSYKEWMQVEGLGEVSCLELKQWENYKKVVDKQIQNLNQYGIKTLFFNDSDYPKLLTFCADAPFVLFFKGKVNFSQRKIISIVGTRKNTPQGRAFFEQLIEFLEPYQPIICSGLAKGIDIIAHRKALKLGLETVACLAHGLERIYPPIHSETARALCKQGGILTDFLPHSEFREKISPSETEL